MWGETPHPKPALRFGFDLSPPGRGKEELALPLFSCSAVVGLMLLIVEQFLNGLQFGLLLFLLAAGLTLVFGIMDFVNLAHGSLYMMGAYFSATFVAWSRRLPACGLPAPRA